MAADQPTRGAKLGSLKWSRRRILGLRVVAVCMGLVAAVGIAELTLRIAGIGFPNFYTPDEVCGVRLRRSTSGVWTKEGHGNVSLNSLGFRGSAVSVKRRVNVCRIAVIGDSFIEALQVDDSTTLLEPLCSLTRLRREHGYFGSLSSNSPVLAVPSKKARTLVIS